MLLASYELGHQPLSLAWPAAALEAAGFSPRVADLSVEAFPAAAVAAAAVVAISVPMHTALRLGVQTAEQVRRLNPDAHICLYGLYAVLNAGFLLQARDGGAPLADSVIGDEAEGPLVELVSSLVAGRMPLAIPGVIVSGSAAAPTAGARPLPTPARDQLPPLSRYARYVDGDGARLVGYVEATRGCLHTCRHCPLTPVYQGRLVVTPVATILADIRQQVQAGAGHITFGDPDFLNGPAHALRVARSLHAEFPGVTFDFTTKVEHILQNRRLFPEFRELGARFIISAFESTSDLVLERLHKGHTVADLDLAQSITAGAGLHIQPTWVPFTPWTTLDDYLGLLAWIAGRGLQAATPPVQLSIRLLVPPGSALLDQADTHDWLGPLDAANFVHTWRHPDPAMDALQTAVARSAEQAAASGLSSADAFAGIAALAYAQAGRPTPVLTPPGAAPAPPRITEDWFC